jgi:hypothetical protein
MAPEQSRTVDHGVALPERTVARASKMRQQHLFIPTLDRSLILWRQSRGSHHLVGILEIALIELMVDSQIRQELLEGSGHRLLLGRFSAAAAYPAPIRGARTAMHECEQNKTT